jgi:hypothetical protein
MTDYKHCPKNSNSPRIPVPHYVKQIWVKTLGSILLNGLAPLKRKGRLERRRMKRSGKRKKEVLLVLFCTPWSHNRKLRNI